MQTKYPEGHLSRCLVNMVWLSAQAGHIGVSSFTSFSLSFTSTLPCSIILPHFMAPNEYRPLRPSPSLEQAKPVLTEVGISPCKTRGHHHIILWSTQRHLADPCRGPGPEWSGEPLIIGVSPAGPQATSYTMQEVTYRQMAWRRGPHRKHSERGKVKVT